MGVHIFLGSSPRSLCTESPSWFFQCVNGQERKTQDNWPASSAGTTWKHVLQIVLYISLKMFIFLFWEREGEREKAHACKRGRIRDRGRENRKQAPHCQRRARWGLDRMNHEIMTWAEIKSGGLTNWATQAPLVVFLFLRVTWGLTSPGHMLSSRRLGGRSLQCGSMEHLVAGALLICSGLWGPG